MAKGCGVLPRPAAVAMLAFAVALMAACYLSGYRPVLPCQARLRAAELALSEGRRADAQRELEAAARRPTRWRRNRGGSWRA